MRNAFSFVLVFACAVPLLVSACGDRTPDNPIGPTPPGSGSGPQTVTVISGETQAPVANAAVRIGSQQGTTDSSGIVTFEDVAANAGVSIEATSFISPRQTRLNGSPLTLIPESLPFYELVYHSSDGIGLGYLKRWEGEPGREVPFYLPPDMQAPAVVRAHEEAFRTFNAAQNQIILRLTDQASAPCNAMFEPVATAVAHVHHDRTRGIYGCTIGYSEESATRVNRITHELGHVYGLLHGTIPGMMSITQNTGLDFSPPEKAVMRLMLTRHSGNMPPDADSTSSGTMSISGSRTFTIVD